MKKYYFYICIKEYEKILFFYYIEYWKNIKKLKKYKIIMTLCRLWQIK